MSAITLARLATLMGYFGLLALTALWVTLLFPSPRIQTSVMLVIFTGPLLIPLRGILHGKPRTHIWMSFLVLLYFMHGIVESWANPAERWLALLEVILSIMLFAGCFFYVRLNKQPTDS